MSNENKVVSLGLVETAFLRRWATIDFSSWNETEVREEFVIQLLHLLGYRKGTSHDIEMEKSLALSEPYHQVGRKRVVLDYAPSLRLRYFWIIEAKPGNEKPMQFKDLLQAHLYAVHPEVQARFIVLCNGYELRVYDAVTVEKFDDALLVVNQQNCLQKYADLREMLGAETMLEFQRNRLLDMARKTLDVEVDIDAFRKFKSEAQRMLRDGEAKVKANARELRSQRFSQWHEEEQRELKDASLEVLFVRMDIPEDGRLPPVEEYVRRVVAADPAERQRLVDKLAMHYRGRPHNIFRGLAVHALARLVEEGVQVGRSSYVHGLVPALEKLTRDNANYWAASKISYALCHLDNAAMRVAYKFCTRLGMGFMAKLVEDAKAAMSTEERIAKSPSVAGLMVPSVGHTQEILWRRYCSKDADGVMAGLWILKAIEQELDELQEAKYPDGNSDLLFFEAQGRGCDQLRGATRNGLNRRIDALRQAGVADDVIAFGEQSWEDLNKQIPPEPNAPDDFEPDWSLKSMVEDLLPKVLRLRFASVLAEVREA